MISSSIILREILMLLSPKILTKLTLVTSVMISLSANALLPTPNPQSAQLTVLNTAPPPLVNESTVQTVLPVQNGLSSAIYAFVVKMDVMGNETLVPVSADVTIQKGDMLEYQGHYTNYTGERIRSTTVSLSVPAGVELVGGVLPLGASGSVDGNRYSHMPLRGNIGGVVQEIPLKYYKALRWNIEDIGIGGTAIVKYRAILK